MERDRINPVESPGLTELRLSITVKQKNQVRKNSELNAAPQFNTLMIKQYARYEVPTSITRNCMSARALLEIHNNVGKLL